MEKTRVGRGAALKKLLEESNKNELPPIPQVSVEEKRESSAVKMGSGRGAFFNRMLSPAVYEEKETSPRGGESSSPSPSPRTLGRGRALQLASAIQGPEGDTKLREAGGVCDTKSGSPPPRSPSPDAFSIQSSMDHMSIQEKPPVVMKGSYGKQTEMSCNYMRVNLEPGKGVFEYEVRFTPDIEARNFRFKCLYNQAVRDVIGDTKTFDGVTLYLPFKLQETITVLKSELPSDGSEVEVKIIFKKQKRLGETIHLYNVLFRQVMNTLGLVLMGRHFFDPTSGKPIPQHKLEVWPGYITAIDEYEGGIMLCCDASHRVLRQETVLQLLGDLRSVMPNEWHQHLMELVIGKSVLTRYNNKTYRVDDVLFNETPLNTFPCGNEEMSYMDYYKKSYGITIMDKDQPLLISKRKVRIRGKEETQYVNLIPELCYITGLTDTMRADFKVMKDVSQFTRISPEQRQYSLKKFITNINSNEKCRRILSSWGLTIVSGTVSLPGRIIPPEEIFFGDSRSAPPSLQTDWSRGATSNPVLSAVDMKNWFIVYPKREEKTIRDFVDMMRKCGPQIGMQVFNPTLLCISDDQTETYLRTLRRQISNQTQIVVVLLLAARADKYSAVKKLCCIEAPIPSQVVLCRTIRRLDKLRSITQKIILQMNCKLGGTLWAVKVPLKNVMVCGIDTYHDPARKSSSIAAIVSSLNPSFTRWFSKVSKQNPGVELMEGLAVGFLASLTKYVEVNNSLPDQILIYRDGVGDGELNHCQEFEYPQLLKCCQVINPEYQPKFLFVIVQKKINTRLFKRVGTDSYENPPPGSIMDHTITRRNWFDFFLVSQCVRQGTVSPTHYVVIHNSTTMTPDQVQRISYKLTHLYYNWPGTIRVPAPCQYAHKLAFLVGESIHKEAHDLLLDKLYYL